MHKITRKLEIILPDKSNPTYCAYYDVIGTEKVVRSLPKYTNFNVKFKKNTAFQ